MSTHRRLSLVISHLRTCLMIGNRFEDLCGQHRSYGLKKLLCLDQRDVGLGVTDVDGTAIISDAPQIR
jgi:hypothetical protein